MIENLPPPELTKEQFEALKPLYTESHEPWFEHFYDALKKMDRNEYCWVKKCVQNIFTDVDTKWSIKEMFQPKRRRVNE